MSCQQCGVSMQGDWEFCPKCGSAQSKGTSEQSDNTNVVQGEVVSTAQSSTELKPWSTVEYGSPWRRACAEFVDLMLIGVLLQAVPVVREFHGLALMWLIEVTSIPYRVLAESSTYQATVGKWWFGLVVTDQQFQPVSVLSALARGVVKALAFPLHAVMLFTDTKHRGIADHAGSTVVIRTWR